MISENHNFLPDIIHIPQGNDQSGGVYNLNCRVMLSSSYKNTSSNKTVTVPGFLHMINTNDNVYQPNTTTQRRSGHINTPSEYADRFRSKPSGRPHIVGFDGMSLMENAGYHDGRENYAFYPSVKLRLNTAGDGEGSRTMSASNASSVRRKQKKLGAKPPPLVLELAPTSNNNNNQREISSARTAPPGRVPSGRSDITMKSTRSSLKSRQTEPPPPVYGNLVDGSDSVQSGHSYRQFTTPRLVIGRENPWVYRYKVKKSMNEVNKLMGMKGPKRRY